MTLKWLKEAKLRKTGNEKFKIRYIRDYKHNPKIVYFPISSKLVWERKRILLGILRTRQRYNEVRTVRAVEFCEKMVREEIEHFFREKERTVSNKSLPQILDHNGLDQILLRIEVIILNTFSERFKRLLVWQFDKVNFLAEFSDLYNQIDKYQLTKKRTVLIASYTEALARRVISNSLESIITDSFTAQLVCNFDISTVLLPELGINSDSEVREWNEEVIKRIRGALEAIKLRLIREIANQIANIFYKTHDAQFDSALELRIRLLKERIEREIPVTDLLEA